MQGIGGSAIADVSTVYFINERKCLRPTSFLTDAPLTKGRRWINHEMCCVRWPGAGTDDLAALARARGPLPPLPLAAVTRQRHCRPHIGWEPGTLAPPLWLAGQ